MYHPVSKIPLKKKLLDPITVITPAMNLGLLLYFHTQKYAHFCSILLFFETRPFLFVTAFRLTESVGYKIDTVKLMWKKIHPSYRILFRMHVEYR